MAIIIPLIVYRRAAEDAVDELSGSASAATAAAAASARGRAVKVVKVIPRQFDAGKLMQPKAIPKDITMIKEDERLPRRASAWSAACRVACRAV